MKIAIAVLSIFAFCHATEDRIIGGRPANRGEFPHQISLQHYNPSINNVEHICGGSIMSEYWMVSAGHCFDDRDPRNYIVLAGLLKLSEPNHPDVQGSYVDKIIVHPLYQTLPTGLVFDIALVKIFTPLTGSLAVNKITLPPANYFIPDDVQLQLSGWGLTRDGDGPNYVPDHLQTVTLLNLNINTCQNILSQFLIYDYNICTGPLNVIMTACPGDSGGPLIKDNVLLGVVSWGLLPCPIAGAPVMYTRVSSFLNWIYTNVD